MRAVGVIVDGEAGTVKGDLGPAGGTVRESLGTERESLGLAARASMMASEWCCCERKLRVRCGAG